MDRLLGGVGTRGDLESVLEAAGAWKPPGEGGSSGCTVETRDRDGGYQRVSIDLPYHSYDQEMQQRHAYYLGRMRDDLRRLLAQRFPNTWWRMDPVGVGLVRKLVHRLDTVYLQPARRRLLLPDDPDGRAAQAAFATALEASGYDAFRRSASRYTTLFRTEFARYYVDDQRHRVVPRKFPPYLVHRLPDPAFPEEIERDDAVLLRLNSAAGLSTDADQRVFEIWRRRGDGDWMTGRVRGDGQVTVRGKTNELVNGDGRQVLPILVCYDDQPDGHAFLDGGQDLLMLARAVNVRLTDLFGMIQEQAYDEMTWQSETRRAPAVTGYGLCHELAPGDAMVAITKNPKIAESREAIAWLLFLFGVTNDLPPAEFLETIQPNSSMALRVSERALLERRTLAVELRGADEQRGFEIFRALYNARAEAWQVMPLPWEARFDWTPGALSAAVDLVELQTRHLRDMEIGASSPVSYLREKHGVDEETAIRIYERERDLLRRYPPLGVPGPAQSLPTSDRTSRSAIHPPGSILRSVVGVSRP